MNTDVWSLVLAAGQGRRLAAVTRGIPKQFWRADGRPSLLEETFERFAALAPPARTAVVIDRAHQSYVPSRGRAAWPADWLLCQPEDRGTAAGVLLALTPVLDSGRDAIVVVTPSDHGVTDATGCRAGVSEAVAAVRAREVDLVLFGVEPSEATSDYGWITPGDGYQWSAGRPFRPVASFVEKPKADVARQLFAERAVWNTMVLVARAEALAALYRTHLPRLAQLFETHARVPVGRRERFLAAGYATLASSDFSRDLLTHARGLAVYTWDQSIGWSDLGTPDRFSRWLNSEPAQISA